MTNQQWWRDAVIYQIYPRSFADSNADGYGDLPGIIDRLPYLVELGIDAIWLSPFYKSPMADAGYDVADYRKIDPMFGNLDDAQRLIDASHAHGLRIIIDLVPNHTSDEHVWFQAALAASPGSPERDRYLFRDGQGEDGQEPPNNWTSVFGGDAWTRLRDADGNPEQWYLHMFDSKQPDLNWENPEVREEFEDILRFWLDRGVDGFRIDVAHGMVKAPGLPDQEVELGLLETESGPQWDQPGVHDIYRSWNKVLAPYEGDRMLVAEAWVHEDKLAAYVRSDEMQQAFNFDFLQCPWDATELRAVIDNSLSSMDAVGAPTTWVLSNHDVSRVRSRLGSEDTGNRMNIGPKDPQPDHELGLMRANAATLLMLALPGSAYIWQGEELGLPDHTTLPDEFRQDPTWFRTKGQEIGRDGCRIPIPWEADDASPTWLPRPDSYRSLAADQQVGVPGSTWSFYRDALRLRRELGLGTGGIEWQDTQVDGVLSFRNGNILVVANTSDKPVTMPAGEVLITSLPVVAGDLPGNAAAWLRLS